MKRIIIILYQIGSVYYGRYLMQFNRAHMEGIEDIILFIRFVYKRSHIFRVGFFVNRWNLLGICALQFGSSLSSRSALARPMELASSTATGLNNVVSGGVHHGASVNAICGLISVDRSSCVTRNRFRRQRSDDGRQRWDRRTSRVGGWDEGVAGDTAWQHSKGRWRSGRLWDRRLDLCCCSSIN